MRRVVDSGCVVWGDGLGIEARIALRSVVGRIFGREGVASVIVAFVQGCVECCGAWLVLSFEVAVKHDSS